MKRYRFVLRVFPRAWRDRYGDELLGVLTEEASGSAFRPYVDIVHSGVVERVHQFQRLVLSGVRFARGRAVALGVGLMVAAVAFSLLTADVDVGTAQIKGVVGRNWRGAYDILVLPRGTGPSASARGHLVQANYLSESAGGITLAQYHKIARMPGVGVAAPLDVVGYVLETVSIPVEVSAEAGREGARVLTVTSRFTADQGLSRYPVQQEAYVYVTPDPLSGLQINQAKQLLGPVERLPDGRHVTVCPSGLANNMPPASSPFNDAPGQEGSSCYSRQRDASTPLLAYVDWSFPVLVAGIDPRAENELNRLGGAMTAGKYLGETEGPTRQHGEVVVLIIASTESFDGDLDHVTVSRLPSSAVGVARSEQPVRIASAFAVAKATPVMHVSITGEQAWQQLLVELKAAGTFQVGTGKIVSQSYSRLVGQYWTAGPVSYRRGPAGQIEAVPVSNPLSVWSAGLNVIGRSYVFAPPAAEDVGFRSLTEHIAEGASFGSNDMLQLVGEYNPYKIPGFSGGRSPLASYRAPVLTGATPASRVALGGQLLDPDGNMAGYPQQPPLMLTTLAGASALENPTDYSGTSEQAAAPIGSIRVRVSGLRGTIQEQLGKVGAIAREITTATGLPVVVAAGSSPQTVIIELPAGKFGRPPLAVSEQWTAVTVALVILRQADKESLALFVLILVVCALFLAGAALAGVRGRRDEVAVLRALGWGRHQVFALVLGEVAMLGVAAGLVGVAVSAMLIRGIRLDVPLWHALLVLPVAAVLATFSGFVPALLAARIEPVAGFAPAARAPRHRGWPVRSITGMAVTGVTRMLGRSALAGAALAAGVAGLAVLLAAQDSFSRSIGDSAMAGLVTASTQGTDLLAAFLAVGLGAASVADITYLNVRERAPELAALSATGWTRGQIGRLLGTEALITAVTGSVLGAAAGLFVGGYAFGLSAMVAAGAGAAAGVGAVAATLGTGMALIFATGGSLAPVLATDE